MIVTDVTPTRLFTGDPNYDKFEQEQFRIGYQFEHRFNDALKVRQNLRYGEVDLTIAIFWAASRPIRRLLSAQRARSTSRLNPLQLTIKSRGS